MSVEEVSGRHDPAKRRRSQRAGKEKGVRIYIAAAELRAAGIDPHGPAPEYRVWPDTTKRGGMRLRLYVNDA